MATNKETSAGLSTRGTRLRSLLASRDISFLMEAHDGLSAKIVEAEKFEGIWASGFSIATAMGLRDSNEASWTDVLYLVEQMVNATSIPIVLDGDTGHGNFNNARRLVKKLCDLRVAGVCLEDKLFPKLNSFAGGCHPLADIDEFCGKLHACRDSQTDDSFVLIARTEALIAGQGLDEALRRAEAYGRAGVDAILIHSRQPSAGEILAFASAWRNGIPLVISPTTYSSTPTEVFRGTPISIIVWANHNIRASMNAMRSVCRQIHASGSVAGVEPQIAPLQDVFELLDYAELREAEARYTGNRRTTGTPVGASFDRERSR
jgi:phosphoenolpyruvate phosphomutase